MRTFLVRLLPLWQFFLVDLYIGESKKEQPRERNYSREGLYKKWLEVLDKNVESFTSLTKSSVFEEKSFFWKSFRLKSFDQITKGRLSRWLIGCQKQKRIRAFEINLSIFFLMKTSPQFEICLVKSLSQKQFSEDSLTPQNFYKSFLAQMISPWKFL